MLDESPIAQAIGYALNQRVAVLTATKRSYGKIQALWDLGPPPRSYLYRRGDYQSPGAEVRPAVPAVE